MYLNIFEARDICPATSRLLFKFVLRCSAILEFLVNMLLRQFFLEFFLCIIKRICFQLEDLVGVHYSRTLIIWTERGLRWSRWQNIRIIETRKTIMWKNMNLIEIKLNYSYKKLACIIMHTIFKYFLNVSLSLWSLLVWSCCILEHFWMNWIKKKT